MSGGLREAVLIFKFRQNRMNGFRDVGGGGRNLLLAIHKASGLYNSLYYRAYTKNIRDIQKRRMKQNNDFWSFKTLH